MRLKSVALILAMGSLGSIAACSRTPAAGVGAVPATATTVHVINDGGFDMDVYVIDTPPDAPTGSRTRLGTALANATTNMAIPASMMIAKSTSLKFLADPVGRKRTSVSRSIVVTRGDLVTLRIPPG